MKEFRDCERLEKKCAKLQFDITYFDNCDSLGDFKSFCMFIFLSLMCIQV